MYSSVALSTFTVLFNHHHHPPLFLNFYIERSETKCKNPVFHTCSDQDTYVESTPGGSLLPPPVHSIFKLFLLNLALCLEEKKKKSPLWFCELHSQYLNVSLLEVQVPVFWGRKALVLGPGTHCSSIAQGPLRG